jgi:hypothetical protein
MPFAGFGGPFVGADGLVGFNKGHQQHGPQGMHLQELSKKKAAKPAKKHTKKTQKKEKSKPNFEKLLANAGYGGLLPDKFQTLLKSNGFSLGVPATFGVPGAAGFGAAPAWNYAATGGPMTSGYAAGSGVSSPYGANVEAWPASPYGDLTAFSAPGNIPMAEDSTTAPYGGSGMDTAVPNPVDALTAPLAGDAFGAGAAANNRFNNGWGASPYGAAAWAQQQQ